MIYVRRIVAILAFLAVPMVSLAAESDVLTRAGAVALMIESNPQDAMRADWYRSHMPPVALFEDVRQDLWYGPYIETGFERGFLRGNHGKFLPGGILNAYDAAEMLSHFWLQDGSLILLPWMQGIYYTPTLQDIASAYGMQTAVGPRPMPRTEFIALLQRIHGPATVTQLPESVTSWVGTSSGRSSSVIAQQTSQPQIAAELPLQDPLPAAIPAPRQTPVPQTSARVTAPQQNAPVIRPAPVVTAASTDAFTISLPSLGINSLAVTHPSNPFTHQGLLEPLKNGVGHLFSYPGRGGKILIYGHSSSYAWDVSPYTKIFRRINELAIGDTVSVTHDGVARTYRVREKKTVPAADMSSYQNEGDGEELILYTCWPPDSISQRYLVIADPVESVASR